MPKISDKELNRFMKDNPHNQAVRIIKDQLENPDPPVECQTPSDKRRPATPPFSEDQTGNKDVYPIYPANEARGEQDNDVSSQELKIEDIRTDPKYENIVLHTEKERQAIELLAKQDREILMPLVVWKGQNILIYGYQYRDVLLSNPEIRYTIREFEFTDWQEAKVWAVEHYIAQPEIIIAQKLQAALQCEEYWLLKEQARQAQGQRNDLSLLSKDKLTDSKVVDALIAKKVGCSESYVYDFKRVTASGKKDIIDQCLSGVLSIHAAYAKVFPPKGKTKPVAKPNKNAPIELEIDQTDILAESEKNVDCGKKKSTKDNGTPIDQQPIAEQIKTAKLPDGAIWIAVQKKEGQLQMVKKSYDPTTGTYHIKVNSYHCKLVSHTEDILILEADHINGGVAEFLRKDDRDFPSPANEKKGC